MPETSKEAEAPESADRFIDRVLSPEYVRSLMSEAGCDIRRGVFHPVMTLWLMMYQRISGRSSLAHALAAFRLASLSGIRARLLAGRATPGGIEASSTGEMIRPAWSRALAFNAGVVPHLSEAVSKRGPSR